MEQAAAIYSEGKTAWKMLIMEWRKGFGDATAEQPDRLTMLNRFRFLHNGAVLYYVKQMGGLTLATRRLLAGELGEDEKSLAIRRESRLLAENITQVASQVWPELNDLLEYTKDTAIIDGNYSPVPAPLPKENPPTPLAGA
jgi:hypothetical protein